MQALRPGTSRACPPARRRRRAKRWRTPRPSAALRSAQHAVASRLHVASALSLARVLSLACVLIGFATALPFAVVLTAARVLAARVRLGCSGRPADAPDQ